MRTCEEKQIGISIPTPLDARLDALVRRANAAGESTSRKELLAALLLDAPENPDQLTRALRAYRTARADQVVVDGDPPGRYLTEAEKRPGPRPRRD